jgi:hypothetical protein
MTAVELATLIGNVITQLDSTLADPNFLMSDPRWQTLYAVRKHLDDLQRALVEASIAEGNPAYAGLTAQITAANTDLQTVIDDITKIGNIITDISTIASLVDQVLKLKP